MATAAETHHVSLPAPDGLSALWLAAVLAYGVGDTLTTLAIVGSPVHTELNPLVRAAVDGFGVAGLVGLKLLAVGVCGAITLHWGVRDSDPLFTFGPAVLLCLLGVLVTAGNLAALG